MDPAADKRGSVFFYAIAFEASLGLLAVGIGWFIGYQPFTRILETCLAGRILANEILWGLIATIPMMLIPAVCEFISWPPLQELKQLVQKFVSWFCGDRSAFHLAVISFVAGLGEELLFRGTLLEGLEPHFESMWLVLAVSSLLFGLAHSITPLYFLLATTVGFYLGVLVLATGSLIPAIVAHSLYDFLVLFYLTRQRRRQE